MSAEPQSPSISDHDESSESGDGRSDASGESNSRAIQVVMPVIPSDDIEWVTAFGKAQPRAAVVSELIPASCSCRLLTFVQRLAAVAVAMACTSP